MAEYESRPEEAYLDRNLAVQVIAKMALQLGFKAGIRNRDGKWPLLYIELPTGQISWHLDSKDLFGEFPDYDGVWDAHTVDEKRDRIRKYLEGKEEL